MMTERKQELLSEAEENANALGWQARKRLEASSSPTPEMVEGLVAATTTLLRAVRKMTGRELEAFNLLLPSNVAGNDEMSD